MARHQAKETSTVCVLTGLMVFYTSILSANTPIDSYAGSSPHIAASAAEPRLHGQRLADIAAEISRRGGVRILVAPEIVDARVESKIEPDNWRSAINTLLKRFDHMAIVDRSGSFRKIWITGRKSFDHPLDAADADTTDGLSRPVAERDRPADPEPDRSMQLPVAIWEPLEDYGESSAQDRSIPSAPVQTAPAVFEGMHVGQPLEIIIPQEEAPLFAVVGETHSQLNGEIQVWSGPIDGAHDTASFTITRGEITTYITVATGTSIYEVSVDNVTGLGQVVNEVDLTKGKTDQDFLVPEEQGAPSNRDER